MRFVFFSEKNDFLVECCSFFVLQFDFSLLLAVLSVYIRQDILFEKVTESEKVSFAVYQVPNTFISSTSLTCFVPSTGPTSPAKWRGGHSR